MWSFCCPGSFFPFFPRVYVHVESAEKWKNNLFSTVVVGRVRIRNDHHVNTCDNMQFSVFPYFHNIYNSGKMEIIVISVAPLELRQFIPIAGAALGIASLHPLPEILKGLQPFYRTPKISNDSVFNSPLTAISYLLYLLKYFQTNG